MGLSLLSCQLGYTLVELSISVTLSGVLLMGVMAAANRLWGEYRADAFGQRMGRLVMAVENLFPAVAYRGLTQSVALQLGVFRDEFVIDASSSVVNHIYNQPITLGVLPDASFQSLAWGVNYARLPPESCLSVVQYALALGDAVALVKNPLDSSMSGGFSSWANLLTWGDGAVNGFPFPSVQVLMKQKSIRPDAVAKIAACSAATQGESSFDLVVVRSRI